MENNHSGKNKRTIEIFLVILLLITIPLFLKLNPFNVDLSKVGLGPKEPKSFRIINGDVYRIKNRETKELTVSRNNTPERNITKFISLKTSPSGKGAVLLGEGGYGNYAMFYLDEETEDIKFLDFAHEVVWPNQKDNYFVYTKKLNGYGAKELFLYKVNTGEIKQLLEEREGKCMMSHENIRWNQEDTAIKTDYTLFDCPLDQSEPGEGKEEVTIQLFNNQTKN